MDRKTQPAATRRQMLALGAVTAATIVTVRPALAQTMGSVLNCQIPVPDPSQSSFYIDPNGLLVDPSTPGAFPPAARPFTGEEVRTALKDGTSLPGTDYATSEAYTNYISRLQNGMSGFTCYASLQMPKG